MKRLSVLLIIFFVNIYSYEPFTIKQYVATIPHAQEYYIGADLGGTHMDFGIFAVQENKPVLLLSLHTKSRTITNFTQLVKDVLNYAYENHGLSIYKACIAVPGTPQGCWDKYTFNSHQYLFDVSVTDILANSCLTTVFLASDSSMIGYGLEYINPKDITLIAGQQSDIEHAQRATLNIGTGLGSSTISWDFGLQSYVAHHGRAGRLEFSPSDLDEYEMAQLMKNITGTNSIYWSNLISGFGIKDLYTTLKSMNKYHDSLCLSEYNAGIIFTHPEDELCAATINTFFKLLVRFVRNYATVVSPFGGLYLAGGVVAKNAQRIAAEFAAEYARCDTTIQKIVEHIPVYMVTDYNVSLYGAMHYLLMHKDLITSETENSTITDDHTAQIKHFIR